jgi:hypothetical protein
MSVFTLALVQWFNSLSLATSDGPPRPSRVLVCTLGRNVQRHKDYLNAIGGVQHVLFIGYTVLVLCGIMELVRIQYPLGSCCPQTSTHFFKVEIAPLVHSEKFDMKRIEVDDL